MDYQSNKQVVYNWQWSLTVSNKVNVKNIDASLLFTDDFNNTYIKAGVPFAVDANGNTVVANNLSASDAVSNMIQVVVHDYKVVKQDDGSYVFNGVFLRYGRLARKNMDSAVQSLYTNQLEALLQSNGIFVLNK
jgi:hypothetical protein